MPYPAYPDGSALLGFVAASGLVESTPSGSYALIGWALRASAAARDFERETSRRFIARGATRTFRGPNTEGILVFHQDLAAAPQSVIVGDVAQVLNTDYWLLPENADADEEPWRALQFANPYMTSLYIPHGISVTGFWGYSLEIPDDVYLAMLAGAAAGLRSELAGAITQGLLRWRDADVEEQYGNDGLKALVGGWQDIWDRARTHYRQTWVG